jgi:hypothetical protein
MSLAHIGQTTEERGHKVDCDCPICHHKSGKDSPRYIPREERICVCGCQKSFICMITSSKRFISGHNKSQLGRKKTKKEIEKQRKQILVKISQYDLNEKFIRNWNGIIEASKKLNINKSSICACLKGRIKTSGKYIWKYKLKT